MGPDGAAGLYHGLVAAAEPMTPSLRSTVRALAPWIEEIRADLHQHPELSYREVGTRERILARLKELGLAATTYGKFTGVTADIGGGHGGPAVALRADMDALPVTEATGAPFSSRTPGVMHACGHDVHMASLLGAARVLVDRQGSLPGPVRLLFQPAEEEGMTGGASGLIARGALRRPKVQFVFGQHVEPRIPAGSLGWRAGMMMAAADEFRITVHGRGGHASQPHLGGDAVHAAAEIVVGLQTLLARTKDPVHPGLISVGMIRGGEKSNVLPPEVQLAGTVRTFDPSLRRNLQRAIPTRARLIARSLGARAEVDYILGYPALVNEPGTTSKVAERLRASWGDARVRELKHPVLGAEDFARYLERAPGTLWFLGSAPNGRSEMSLHSPGFLPDPRALTAGAEALLLATESVQGAPA